jgi:hypothetical protein
VDGVGVLTRHPSGVIVNNHLYRRDFYYASDRISVREWLALGLLVLGVALWALLLVGGTIWVISTVVRGLR